MGNGPHPRWPLRRNPGRDKDTGSLVGASGPAVPGGKRRRARKGPAITHARTPRGVRGRSHRDRWPPSRPGSSRRRIASSKGEVCVHRKPLGVAVEVDRNYKSFEENEEESRQEVARLEAEGHLERIGCWNHVRRRWKGAIATKVATLVKQKSDGTQKVRFIVDMLRSGVNSLAVAGERIVLPRATDLINSTLRLWEAARPGEFLEFLTIDIADAFLNLQIKEGERANTIIRAQDGDYLVYKGVPFGLATAPLLWGRVAAWLGRATQSIFERARVRTQIYVDDPVLVVRGYGDARRWYLARAILLWAALGARLALKKASRGTKVTWIGAQYEVLQQGIKVGIDQQRVAKLQEAMASVSAGKGLVNLRSLTGELSWVAGLVPKIRPWVTMLWAACHAADLQHLAASQGRSKAKQRPRNMVFTNMVAQPLELEWLTAFLQGCHGGVERVRWVSDRASRPNLLIRADASTTGMGGVLFGSAREPVAYWTCLLDPEMCSAPRGLFVH